MLILFFLQILILKRMPEKMSKLVLWNQVINYFLEYCVVLLQIVFIEILQFHFNLIR